VHWTDGFTGPYVRGMPAADTGASTTTGANATALLAADSRLTPGGGAGYRRMSLTLFLAGVATFALLCSTQALLPLVSRDFGVTTSANSWTVSGTTGGLALFVLQAVGATLEVRP
jgi:YNFM family putative membrane transporter